MIALGLDVGGTNLKYALFDGNRIIETGQDTSSGGVAAALDFIRENRGEAERIGVGLAGLVSHPSGRFLWGPHLQGIGLEVADAVGPGVKVVVDNDANMAALAEIRMGAARSAQSALVLTLGTGIGAAIVVGGSVYRGRSHAGEIGHVRAVDDGSLCACGHTGCWETLVSGAVLDREASRLAMRDADGLVAREAAGADATAVHLVAAAEAGDALARRILETVGRQLGRLIATQVAVLDPEVVVIAGAVAGAGDALFGSVDTAVASNLAGAAYREPVDIRISPFLGFSGAIGAAVFATEATHV